MKLYLVILVIQGMSSTRKPLMRSEAERSSRLIEMYAKELDGELRTKKVHFGAEVTIRNFFVSNDMVESGHDDMVDKMTMMKS